MFIVRGSIIGAIIGELAATTVFSLIIVFLHARLPGVFAHITLPSVSVLGLAISIFLGFRNNICYQRWWEARCQWGALIAANRAFMREVMALFGADEALARRLGFRLIAFAHALRANLREGGSDDAAANWLSPAEQCQIGSGVGQGSRILRLQSQDLAALRGGGQGLGDILYRGLADRLDQMTGIQAACERLRSTPTPFAYTLLLHRTAWLFCLLLPCGLVSMLGAATPLVTLILAYAFFGLDALGQELQEPFSARPNAVPLDALVRLIEISVLESLGTDEIPPPLMPRGFILN